ncbi:hypothetical protein [Pedobacter sp. Leaf194]|uniref:hypothetical protein n=1 Tax=Pedobacter sp. Leaf194 TaxID=1736297 RepID=UPI00070358A6|nr:hypothetical protein [Pedobacter sp. Leaf194]KQS32454.1 hypothetical protein ASG14_16345 [Pedobacter sp. Leaf194]
MRTNLSRQKKNRIILLDDEEIVMPIKPITAFFDAAWLPDQLKMLKKWRNDVSFEANHPLRSSPSDRLYDYELTMKVIEAAWLVRKKTIGKLEIDSGEIDIIVKWCIKQEKKGMRDYPTHLAADEIINPVKVLRRVFKTFKLRHYHAILKNWLYDSLSQKYMEDSLSKEEIIAVYENLVRLFEAMWLIKERNKAGA